MAVLAALVIPALLLESAADQPELQLAGQALNWVIWLALCAEFLVRLAIAPARLRFTRRSWFDLALIVLTPPFLASEVAQGGRSLRLVRLLRLLRSGAVLALAVRRVRHAFARHKFHYVAVLGISTVAIGAGAIYVLETGQNEAIGSLADALWWAVVTTTTVGTATSRRRQARGDWSLSC